MKELSDDPGSAQAGTSYDVTPDAQLVPPFKQLSLRLRLRWGDRRHGTPRVDTAAEPGGAPTRCGDARVERPPIGGAQPPHVRPVSLAHSQRGETRHSRRPHGCPCRGCPTLRYPNPPGGEKSCRNTHLARCELTLDRPGKPRLALHSNRAAFEILDAV